MTDVASEVRTTPLARPFRVSHTVVPAVTEVHLRVDHDGVAGTGVVALGPWRNDAASAVTELATALVEEVMSGTPDVPLVRSSLTPWYAVAPSACQLAEMCLLDHISRRRGQPLWQILELPPPPDRLPLLQTLSLGEAPPTTTDSEAPPRLKVKLGGPDDDEVVRALSASGLEAVVDVNRGWSEADLARLAPRLREVRLLAIEDPVTDAALLPAVRRQLPTVPILLDEGIDSTSALDTALADADGVNLKLAKFGGLLPTIEAARTARRSGKRLMLGCFIEPPRSIGYAATMSGLADWWDLDGHTWLVPRWSRTWLQVDASRPGSTMLRPPSGL